MTIAAPPSLMLRGRLLVGTGTIAFLVVLAASGCQEDRSTEAGETVQGAAAPDRTAQKLQSLGFVSGGRVGTPSAPATPRMIIRTAEITLVVDDAAESLRRIVALVEKRGGHVAETRQWRQSGQVRATATLRIPAERLSEVLPEIREGAIRVENEAVTGQDVSEEFSDLGAQLRNLQATETELRELLNTVRQRAKKASDILEVYTELTKVRGEIERIQGRMGYLTQMTALSTITLELIPDVLAKPVVEPGWRPGAVAKNASRALVNGVKGLAEAVIWFAIFVLPLGLLFAGLALLIRSVAKRFLPRGGRRGPPSERK